MDNNREEKSRDMQEWGIERDKVKSIVDVAVDCHNRAKTEVSQENYDTAIHFYKEAIKDYRDALDKGLKYYSKDLLDKISRVVSEYMRNVFILKLVETKVKEEGYINEFLNFTNALKQTERKYIYAYDIARICFSVANFYYEKKDLESAYQFYNKVIEAKCDRSFINRDAYFRMGKIQFEQMRFKEAVVNFVSVLSFDMDNKEVIGYIEDCLARLNISKHKKRFLSATPNEAKKLIMEVL